jgi:hypothetical protein
MSTRRRHGTQQQVGLDYYWFCPSRLIRLGGIAKAFGLDDGPTHRQTAIAKLRRLRLTMPPSIVAMPPILQRSTI